MNKNYWSTSTNRPSGLIENDTESTPCTRDRRTKAMSISKGMKVLSLAAMATLTMACGAEGPGDGDGMTGGDTGGSCNAQGQGVAANQIVATVSWPDTIGVVGGSGQLVIWTRAELDFDGTNISGSVSPCGSTLPVIQTKAIVGGHKIQPIIPDEIWDLSGMPQTTASGTVSGFDPGSTILMQPATALLGLAMADVEAAWPDKWADIQAVDHDGDGAPGITSVPNTNDGFSAPPTGIFPDSPKASALYLVSRSVVELQGTRDSCTTASGTAIVHNFDNHIIGCALEGGGECDDAQTSFIDSNRTVYKVESATYDMKQLPEGVSCADVRAAFQ